MQKCNYCGVITKYKVDKCPYCGATQYSEIDAIEGQPYELKSVAGIKFSGIPKPKVTNNSKHLLIAIITGIALIVLLIGLSLIVFAGIDNASRNSDEGLVAIALVFLLIFSLGISIFFFIKTKNDELGDSYDEVMEYFPKILITLVVIGIISVLSGAFIIIAFIIGFIVAFFVFSFLAYMCGSSYNEWKSKDTSLERYSSLLKNGMLIKNVPYKLEPVGNGSNLNRLSVDYTTSSGVRLRLKSDKIYSGIPADKDVDILVDKTNYGNYFIDLEIH